MFERDGAHRAGHGALTCPPLEQPEAFIAAIKEFVGL
jgi:hypothetical protein